MSCQKCGSTDTYCGCDEETAIAERDAALAELAALKKRLADARTISLPNVDGWFLLVAMNDGEIKEHIK